MAVAGRCLHRLLASSIFASSRLHAPFPASFSASASLSPAIIPNSAPGASPDPLGRYRSDSNTTRLRASSSFSTTIDTSPRSSTPIPSAPGINHFNKSPTPRGLQILTTLDTQDKKITTRSSSSSSNASPPANDTIVTEKPQTLEASQHEEIAPKPKTLEDFQHEEIVGPTVDRDLSPIADELRQSLDTLHKRILSFQKSLILLGALQTAGALWCWVSWHGLNPTWQLVPSAAMAFLLAVAARQAEQPIKFFGKLEERSRLRVVTMMVMVVKGLARFFARARLVAAATALALVCVLLYAPGTYLLGLLGILK